MKWIMTTPRNGKIKTLNENEVKRYVAVPSDMAILMRMDIEESIRFHTSGSYWKEFKRIE